MERREKEEKKQVGETERTRKKGTTHNTQKNEDFLLESDPGVWTKQEIYQQHSGRGEPTQLLFYHERDAVIANLPL